MRAIRKYLVFILCVLILAGAYFFFKYQETNYDSIIAIAAKKQKDLASFVDFYGEIEPAIPDKVSNSKTILGYDVNTNGVRDDIDVWINRTGHDLNETKAMRQYARASQELLKICEQKNPHDFKVVQNTLLKAEKCLASLSDYQRKELNFAKTKLEILIYNTDLRSSCKSDYLKHADSQIIGNDVHFFCDFEIQYFDNVVFGNREWQKSDFK